MKKNLFEVIVVGKEFIPGPKSDAKLASLLKLESTTAPRFHADKNAALSALHDAGAVAYVMPNMAGCYVCVFAQEEHLYATAPFAKPSYALAAALAYVLDGK